MKEAVHTKIVSLQNRELLRDGVYLVVLHADKIPPHIGFLHDGKFFSQKANGKDVGLNVSRLISVIDAKRIPVLFYALNGSLPENAVAIFEVLPSKIEKGKTCLDPICEVLAKGKRFAIVAELIEYLEEKELINSCYGLHLPVDFESLPNYSRVDVRHRIAYLTNDKRR